MRVNTAARTAFGGGGDDAGLRHAHQIKVDKGRMGGGKAQQSMASGELLEVRYQDFSQESQW